MLLNTLGVLKDNPPLTSELYRSPARARQTFNSAAAIPMAANIGFVLFDCGNNNSGNDRYKIAAFHNEKPMFIPKCNDFVCNWKDFKNVFKV